MTSVRRLTYLLRPLKPGENEDENCRKTCAVAIDTANRKTENLCASHSDLTTHYNIYPYHIYPRLILLFMRLTNAVTRLNTTAAGDMND